MNSTRWFLNAGAVLLAAQGCGNDIQSPTEPVPASPQGDVSGVSALAFSQVSGGTDGFTCGITTDQRAYCWGRNYRGPLGDGTTVTARLTPVAVATTLRFQQVSAGWGHSCGVTPAYRAYCWGDNGVGALGDGTTNNHYTPVAVAGGRRFREVDAGADYTCAISYPEDRAYCWGNNWAGQLGDGTTTTRLKPVPVMGGLLFNQVRVGAFHTCGIAATYRAYCWGYNATGRLGDGTTVSRLRPTRVAAGTRRLREIDAGGDHTCAVTPTNRAFCWGGGTNGALGNGNVSDNRWPRAVAGGLFFARITTGNGHTCGQTTGNRVYCWGYNGQGQLGDGTTTTRLTPVRLAGGLSFAQVSAGSVHTCGTTPADVAYCWGDNLLGALGDGTWQNHRTIPVPVADPM